MNFLKIGRRLPEPIKKVLRLWTGRVKLDKEIIKDLAAYSHLSEEEVIWLCQKSEKLHSLLWKILNPKTKKEISDFYKNTPFYIFELSFWHMKRSQKIFRKEIVGWARGEVLDFGAGTGDLCLKLKEKGFNVDYTDVSGTTLDFAQWLFKKRGLKIKIIRLDKEKLSKNYDTIYCLDVIEHLPNPAEVLTDLASRLNKQGRLIITNLNIDDKSLKAHPMHLKPGINLENHLNSLGLYKTEKLWLWIKT